MVADSPETEEPKKLNWLKNLFFFSRILVVIVIIGLLIASIIVIIAGFGELFRMISFLMNDGLLSHDAGKVLSVNVTEMIDLFLIGLVLIITAIGLYQLFINPDLVLPEWLNTPTFDTLKERLLVIILVLLAVIFLGSAATATDGVMIAGLGIAVASVIAAIGYILSIAIHAKIEKMRLDAQMAELKK